jgi:hypothetical protein
LPQTSYCCHVRLSPSSPYAGCCGVDNTPASFLTEGQQRKTKQAEKNKNKKIKEAFHRKIPIFSATISYNYTLPRQFTHCVSPDTIHIAIKMTEREEPSIVGTQFENYIKVSA